MFPNSVVLILSDLLCVMQGKYETLDSMLRDLRLIATNAREYNPRDEGDERGRQLVHAASNLVDGVESYFHRFSSKVASSLKCSVDKTC